MTSIWTDLDQPKGLGKLNSHLLNNSYITGYQPSKDDADVFNAIKPGSFDPKKFVHLNRWYKHIMSWSAEERASWPAPESHQNTASHTEGKKKTKKEEKKEAKKEETVEFDPFAEETTEDTQQKEQRAQLVAKEKEERDKKLKEEEQKKEGKKDEKKVVARSCVIFDISPWEVDEEGKTDIIDAIEKRVRSITMEGLEWKAREIVKIGFGINKLRIMCHIVDDLVSVELLQETIESNEDLIQSVTIHAFNKL
jgi:elongation factor 1-beta